MKSPTVTLSRRRYVRLTKLLAECAKELGRLQRSEKFLTVLGNSETPLPPLKVGIFTDDAQLLKVIDREDPREEFCREFNQANEEFELIAHPLG